MSAPWPVVALRTIISDLEAGVSVNALDEPISGDGEIGVLKVSCVSHGRFLPHENKRVVAKEQSRVAVSPNRGDIIISRANTFDLIGACGYVEEDYPNLFLSDKLWRAVLAEPTVDSSRWVIALLTSQRLRKEFHRRATGTSGSMKNISKQSLLAIEVPRPPADVQAKLGAIFERFDKCIALMDCLIRSKRAFKRGLTQMLLGGQKRVLGGQPGKWRVCRLGELVRHVPRKVPKPTGQFLSAGVRSHGKGVFLKHDFQSSGIALVELFQLKHRDLVINITFGWEGAVAIVPQEADGALVSHRFPTYEVDESKVLVEYLRYVIQSKRFVCDVGAASPGGAGRNRVLNRREFLDIPLSIPCIDEQRQIAGVLNMCDREISLLVRQREYADVYRRMLLSKLLSGEVALSS